MRKQLKAVALACIMMILTTTVSAALATDGKSDGILADIEYSSVAYVQDKIFFLGKQLYAYDAANGGIIKENNEAIQILFPEKNAAHLVLVSGGNALHALDTTTGNFYELGQTEGFLVRRLENNIFRSTTDPLEQRAFKMPTIVSEDDGENLYLLVSKEDSPTAYELMYFDLSSGISGTVEAGNTILFTQYKAGRLAAVIEKPGKYRIIEIDITTHKVGGTLYEDNDPRYRISGMVYDPEKDRLIIITGRGLYRIEDQEMVDLYAHLPNMIERNINDDNNYFIDGKYVFINQNVLYTNDLNAENALKGLRIANSGISNKSVMGFMQENPDVKVSFTSETFWNLNDIVVSLLSQNSDVDIIQLYAGAGLSAIKSKVYYADLSGSKEIAEDISLMYPQIRDVLMDGNHIIAYPSDMLVYSWLVDENALRQKGYDVDGSSMQDWMSFVEEIAKDFNAEESPYSIFPPGFTKRELFNEMITQYIVENEVDDQLSFSNPELKDILERVISLPESIFWENDSDGSAMDAYDHGQPPLFVVSTMLSPDAYIGFYEQYKPRYVAPPAFIYQTAARATMSVYIINPYSQNKETAIEFIKYCAEHADPLLRFYLDENFNQPIPNEEYVRAKERISLEIAELTHRLEKASAENRPAIEEGIAQQRIQLEYIAMHEWLVSETDIAAYQKLAPTITFLPHSLCFTDSSYSVTTFDLYKSIDMLMTKTIDLGRFLAETDRYLHMMHLERE